MKVKVLFPHGEEEITEVIGLTRDGDTSVAIRFAFNSYSTFEYDELESMYYWCNGAWKEILLDRPPIEIHEELCRLYVRAR